MIKEVEFYSTPDGSVMVKWLDGRTQELLPDNKELITSILDVIKTSFPGAVEAIEKLYSKSKPNRAFFEYRIVTRFCRCNWGKYDNLTLDIDADGIPHLEEVECPLRDTGDCPFCGIICKPKIKTVLTDREIEIVRWIAKGLTNEDIGNILHISMLTVIRHRNNIRQKLGAANTASMINLIHNIL